MVSIVVKELINMIFWEIFLAPKARAKDTHLETLAAQYF